jgi:hypothetical protein
LIHGLVCRVKPTSVRFKSANPWQLAEITLILAALRDLDATPAVIAGLDPAIQTSPWLHPDYAGKSMKPASYWIAGSSPAMTAGVWNVWPDEFQA